MPLFPLDECPFAAPECSVGADYRDYEAELAAQVGDYDFHGPFEARDDDFTPF
jgi:hypothetical protein